MRIKLVKIGNSIGVRLPKSALQECGFENEVEMTVQDRNILLSPPQGDRTAWYELFHESVRQKPVQEKGEWEW